MPLYVYEVIHKNKKNGRRFEVMQGFSDAPLTHDPETGEPVQRVYFAPHAPKNRYEKALKQISKEDKKNSPPKNRGKKGAGSGF